MVGRSWPNPPSLKSPNSLVVLLQERNQHCMHGDVLVVSENDGWCRRHHARSPFVVLFITAGGFSADAVWATSNVS